MAMRPSYTPKPKSAAPASSSNAGGKKDFVPGKPVYSIKVKEGDEFVLLCNLFENKTKTGETFYKGRQKDDKGEVVAEFFVMPITPRDDK
jgi:hypothetical protein